MRLCPRARAQRNLETDLPESIAKPHYGTYGICKSPGGQWKTSVTACLLRREAKEVQQMQGLSKALRKAFDEEEIAMAWSNITVNRKGALSRVHFDMNNVGETALTGDATDGLLVNCKWDPHDDHQVVVRCDQDQKFFT